MFKKLELNDKSAWLTACQNYVIRLEEGDKPYKILSLDQDGSYRKVGSSKDLLKAQRSICYRLGVPIPDELAYENQAAAVFNPPRLKVLQGGNQDTPGVAEIRQNIRNYLGKRNG